MNAAMKFNSQTEKEIKEIYASLTTIAKKKGTGKTLTPEEMTQVKLDSNKLTNIVKSYPAETNHTYEEALKKMPKELAEKVKEKVGVSGLTNFVDKLNSHIKPDAEPFNYLCLAFTIAMLAEQWEFLPEFLGACGFASA